jgi:hypothetical protein
MRAYVVPQPRRVALDDEHGQEADANGDFDGENERAATAARTSWAREVRTSVQL